MSSRSRTWSEVRPLRTAAALLAVTLAWWVAPVPAYAAVPLPVDAVFSDGGQTSVVVDLSASTRPGPRTVTVTRDGTPQPAQLVPVMNDDLAVTLVVDASAGAEAALPAWLSGAARFILEAPEQTRGVIIADSKPAAPITGPQRGPTEIVRALTGVQARGVRDTGAALTLAAGQFRDAPAGHRVTVLYTTAADAGGETAAELAARFRAAGTILVVAGTTDGGTYWSEAAQGTGGFFAPAGNPVVVPALDQVQTTLSSRYLVVFATPPRLPARVTVRVGTGDLTLTGDVEVPVPGFATARQPRELSASTVVWWSLGAAGLVGLILVIVLLWRLRAAGAGESPVVATPAAAPARPTGARNSPHRVAWATGRNGTGWNAFPVSARNESPSATDRIATPSTPARSASPEPEARSVPPEPETRTAPSEPGARTAPPEPETRTAPPEPDTRTAPPEPETRTAPSEPAPAPWAGNLPVYKLPEGPGPGLPDEIPPVVRGRAAVPPYVARGRAAVPDGAQPPDAHDERADAAVPRAENESRNSD